MNIRTRALLVGASAVGLCLAVAGCGGSSQAQGADLDSGSETPAGDSAENDATDTGSVTVVIDSGPLAGSHEGSGDLTCGHGKFGGDEIWLVFSDEIDDAHDLTLVNVYSAPESEQDNPESPYVGQSLVLEVGVGNFFTDTSKKLVVNGDVPGTLDAREVDGTTIRVSATTGDGVAIDVEAHCSAVDEESTDPAPAATSEADVPDAVATSAAASEQAGDFCEAVVALNELPESEVLTAEERERALAIVDDLLRLWPADTKDPAEIYFGEIRDALLAGSAVDLDNSSAEFQEAFVTVFESAADACPGGFG